MINKRSEYDALFDNGVFPVIVSDMQKKTILKVNSVFSEWFHIEKPDFSTFVINEDPDNFQSVLRTEGIFREFSLSVLHENGTKINCLATANAASDIQGNEEVFIIIHESINKCRETAVLKTRSANLFALSENIKDIFWSVDSNLRLVNFNKLFTDRTQQNLNISLKTGDQILELIPEQMRSLWEKRYDIALKGIEEKYIDELMGSTAETIVNPIYSEINEVIGVCCTMRDLTERINTKKNLNVIHKRFSSILNSSADAAIIASDPQGIIRQFNRGASAMLGYDHDEVIGKTNLLKFFPPSTIRSIINILQTETGKYIKKEQLFHYLSTHPEQVGHKEWFFLNKSGQSIDIKISISTVLMENDEFAGVLIIAQDISELNRIKEELEMAKIHAEEISKTKSGFLANMSHEIRTPLNGIIGMADLLRTTEQTDVQENYSSIILKSANSLLLLINDILDYSKIEAGKMKLGHTAFQLRSMMNDIKDMLQVSIKEKDIQFDIYTDPSVSDKLIGDPRRIKQIMLNLVGNALKFTIRGYIKIEIYQISENADEITLYFKVIDSGIGISDSEKEKLFKSFSQVDPSTTRKYGGTGLGLAISKELVSMMNGEIGVESSKEKGSTFWFTIKLKNEPENFGIKKILIVNSNSLSRKTLKKEFDSLDLSVTEAVDCRSCIKALESGREKKNYFDLVCIDKILTDNTGQNLASEIRKNYDSQGLRIIQTSYSPDRETDIFDGTLTLPTSRKAVKGCLKKIFKSSEPFNQYKDSDTSLIKQGIEDKKKPIRILVAEDNKINQLVALNFLKKLGYDSDLVENGRDAVEACRTNLYDLILMDQMMPVMDGIEATGKIRNEKSGKTDRDVTIIALTANAMKGDREFLLNSGMDDYISKPVLLKDIKAVIEKNLKKQGKI